MILDVEATPAHRTAEVEASKAMVDRVKERFDLAPERLIADTAYGSAPMLTWPVEEKAIEPHVPVWEKTERSDGTFSRRDFQWDEQANEYRCPAVKRCDAGDATSQRSALASRKPTPSFIVRVRSIAHRVR